MSKTLVTRKPSLAMRSPLGRILPRTMLNELFDQFLTDGDSQLAEVMNVAMDVAETDHAFEVKMDLPGINSDDVDIQIDNNTLTVRGHRSEEIEEKDEEKQFHRIERYSGSFSRSVVLPNAINEDKTMAEFSDGVLTIIVPKTEDAKPRKIKIKS